MVSLCVYHVFTAKCLYMSLLCIFCLMWSLPVGTAPPLHVPALPCQLCWSAPGWLEPWPGSYGGDPARWSWSQRRESWKPWCVLVRLGASWCVLVRLGASWCVLVHLEGACFSLLIETLRICAWTKENTRPSHKKVTQWLSSKSAN